MEINIKQEARSLLIITFGMLCLALGLNFFLTPSRVFTTGVMGFSQEITTIINYFVEVGNITPIIYWLINVPTFILGWCRVGKRFTLRTFYAVTILSLLTGFIPSDIVFADDQILSVLAGSILIGVGTGVSLKVGGSSGGTDIIALYISMFKGKSFGTYNLILNSIVIALAVILTKDFNMAILMFVSTYVISLAVDKTHTSLETMSLFIVTSKGDEVRQALLDNHLRGLTIIDTEGGLSRAKNQIIFMTVDRGELFHVMETAKIADEKAFINVYHTVKVVGEFADNYRKIL